MRQHKDTSHHSLQDRQHVISKPALPLRGACHRACLRPSLSCASHLSRLVPPACLRGCQVPGPAGGAVHKLPDDSGLAGVQPCRWHARSWWTAPTRCTMRNTYSRSTRAWRRPQQQRTSGCQRLTAPCLSPRPVRSYQSTSVTQRPRADGSGVDWVVTPTSTQYQFRTKRAVPKLGCAKAAPHSTRPGARGWHSHPLPNAQGHACWLGRQQREHRDGGRDSEPGVRGLLPLLGAALPRAPSHAA